MLKNILLIISLPIVVYSQADTTSVRFAKSIKAAELKEYLYVLASDSLEGRETGEPGQKKAARYMADFFAKSGLEPGFIGKNGRSYFQEYSLIKSYWSKSILEAGSAKYTYLKDFFMNGAFSLDKLSEYDVVFAGFGIETATYNDYKNLDVKDKIVLVFTGEPINKEGINLVTGKQGAGSWGNAWKKKAELAKLKGAKGLVMVMGTNTEMFDKYITNIHHWLEKPAYDFPEEVKTDAGFAVFTVSPLIGAAVLNLKNDEALTEFRSKIANGDMPKKIKTKKLTLQASRTKVTITAENVLGYLEGTDKKDEVVIVTAHYDHLGISEGKIYYGADDDASGTATVMELAQAFAEAKKAGKGPRRSILFMPVSGEEKGLLGSDYYTRNPVYPLAKTVCNLNIDMIGRLDSAHATTEDYVYLIGSDKLSTELHEVSEKVNATYSKLALDYRFNDDNDPNRFYYRSDHYNFAKNGVPVIFYFNGVHEDYHKATDTKEKILFGKIEKIAKLVYHTAWEVANREQKLVVDKPIKK